MFHQFRFSGNGKGPHLLITGGVHGDEFEPIAAIRELVRRFDSDPRLIEKLQGRLTLVPLVNEAAFLRGHRSAEDQLDLARCCPGRPDGSVTEQTAWHLSELIRSADFYIDLHTGGTEYAVHPLAGYTLHRDLKVLENQRRMARAFNLPTIWGTASNLEGRSLSVARDANVPAIYCEYLGSARCDSGGVAAYVEGCLNVMGELNMLPRPKPPSRIEYVIEDARPNSGHMQVQNPSPVTGFFEPAVTLGARIRAAETIGTVYELASLRPHDVASQEDGLVLVLRTFPRVNAGESVGVIAALTSGAGPEK